MTKQKTSQDSPRQKLFSAGSLIFLLVVGVSAAALYMGRPYFHHMTADTQDLATLEATTQNLQQNIDTLYAQIEELRQQRTIPNIEKRLTALENATVPQRSLTAEEKALISRFVTVHTKDQQSKARLIEALRSLQDKAKTSAPFEVEYISLANLALNFPVIADAVARLNDFKEGVPTAPQLKDQFTLYKKDLGKPPPPTTDKGVVGNALAALTSVVRIRKVGEGAAKDATAQAIEQAQTALNHLDLPGAIKALSTLEAPTLSPALSSWLSSWQKNARQRIDLEKELDDLQIKAYQALAGDA